jgi:NAD(P)-dependent dehydrogenase (short-subunit alcohol dehydrogenase family)
MLTAGRGSIVNIASVHSLEIIPHTFAYPVVKHGVVGLTRALAIEYARHVVRVNAICPGYIETRITIEYFASLPDPEGERAEVEGVHPLGRLDRPEETAAYGASDEAAFITGASLLVDGGRLIVYHE